MKQKEVLVIIYHVHASVLTYFVWCLDMYV